MIKTNTLLCCLIAALMLPLMESCRKDSASAPAQDPEPQTAETIVWEPMAKLPHAVKECTCVFSADAAAYAGKEYLYGDNVTAAFVKLDGKQRRLVNVKVEESEQGHIVKTFHDGFYWMRVDLQQEQQTEEAQELFKETGTITITAKDGRSVTKKIVGECGC